MTIKKLIEQLQELSKDPNVYFDTEVVIEEFNFRNEDSKIVQEFEIREVCIERQVIKEYITLRFQTKKDYNTAKWWA
jgi:hypothetical protein